jgi:hypothetical protein
MQQSIDPNDYELREEYELSKMMVVAKGRYAPDRRRNKNIVLLAEDVSEAFPTDEAVNEALRLVMQIGEIPAKYEVGAVQERDLPSAVPAPAL